VSEAHPATENERLCPSSTCKPGATLLGIVQEDGRVGFLRTPLTVDEDFVEKVERGRKAEKRFSFSSPCVESSCRQWTGHSCGVIERVMGFLKTDGPPETLPLCSIRARCRWFHQEGARACSACPEVITDLT
jgi:hypothetical protein